MNHIRNFSIIAHINHGKSTLSDRLIELTGVISQREFKEQILDSMDIERERGITIKSQAVSLPYTAEDGRTYVLNLIDTPGHVDFTYEVSRSLSSCEGVLLLVDASQGVEAQTVANLYLAMDHGLEIIPIINKIDLPAADVEWAKHQIELPAPQGAPDGPLQALIFDSKYDIYRGTVIYCRVFEGTIRPEDTIRFMSNDATYRVEEVGVFRIKRIPKDSLAAGEVGYVIAGVKTVSDTRCGDTITHNDHPCVSPLPGFREVKPVVFSSLYSTASDGFEDLAVALEKLKLNDASLVYERDASAALGSGFRCGFLGLLHLEVIQERLEREFDLSLIITAPSVKYRFMMKDGTTIIIDNPSLYPDPTKIAGTQELYIRASMMMPDRYLGTVLKLCRQRRGTGTQHRYLERGRLELTCELPLAEVVYDFHDRLKTVTQGYGSLDYELLDYRESNLVRLDILINGEKADALSQLVHRDRAPQRARYACERLKDEIPRQQFRVIIQGAIGANIIARETITPFRKDVTAKLYGGDITRKRKLLEKQKKGKKRMKMVGSVEVPQSAFLAVLKRDGG
ncbi:MAG: elongation factor 4 [Deltaproteobacteria bacterium]|nr:elongation factor 4 [Deltaproteobacteria bacterium]